MSDAFTFALDDKDVLALLQELLDRSGAQGMAPALGEIGEVLTESTQQRFVTSTGPDGQRWAPNAEATYLSYLASRKGFSQKTGKISAKGQAQAINKRPLVASGLLADTINWQLVDGGLGVEVGTNRFSGEWDGGAAVHQFGSKDGTIPERPFLGLSVSDKESVLEILSRHLAAR